MQGDRDEEQRGLCYDQPQVWMVTVVVTLSDILPCVLRGEVGPVGKDSSSRTGCKFWQSLQALESVEENRETRGQDRNRAQTSTRGDPPHHCGIFWREVSHIFLRTLRTSDAVALSLRCVEPHLCYGKLATSYMCNW
jgi:hypothetical protein